MLCSHFRTDYLDDVSARDLWSVILADLLLIREEAAKIGLVLNPSKNELIIFGSNTAAIAREFKRHFPTNVIVDSGDATLLGAPSGSRAVEKVLAQKHPELKNLCTVLSSLPT